jgi:hypothetical protein
MRRAIANPMTPAPTTTASTSISVSTGEESHVPPIFTTKLLTMLSP